VAVSEIYLAVRNNTVRGPVTADGKKPKLVKRIISEICTLGDVNKKLVGLFAVAVMLAIIALWSLVRIPSIGNANNLFAVTIKAILLILAFPMKLYVEAGQGHHGSWPLPLLAGLLALSGMIWGIIMERLLWVISRGKLRK
jgi:hypothetical protein